MASNNGHISDYTQPSRPPNIVITQIIDVPKAPRPPQAPRKPIAETILIF